MRKTLPVVRSLVDRVRAEWHVWRSEWRVRLGRARKHGRDLVTVRIAMPEEILEAISHESGGRVVLVIGAGTSHDEPTNLPLAGALARECYERLVADHVISRDACGVDDQNDLSAIADVIFEITESQQALVDRFPPQRFLRAEPNEGNLIAAALMREGKVPTILSLNFDLAQDTALTSVGAGTEVTTIAGPHEHDRIGVLNLIHLHRSIREPPDDLILRTAQLDSAWKGGWEEVIAQRVVSGSITVFVGLGSPSAVLIESTKRLIRAVGNRTTVYVVDPAPVASSKFFNALELDSATYLQLGWIEFLDTLANRVLAANRAELEGECAAMIDDNDWDDEDVSGVCERLYALGLLRIGRLRAQWLLRKTSYAPHSREREVLQMLADLVIAIALLARLLAVVCVLTKTGRSTSNPTTDHQSQCSFAQEPAWLDRRGSSVRSNCAGTECVVMDATLSLP